MLSFFNFSHKFSLKSIDVPNIILSPLSRSKFLYKLLSSKYIRIYTDLYFCRQVPIQKYTIFLCKSFHVDKTCHYCYILDRVKGVFSKSSGNRIVAPIFRFLSYVEISNFGYSWIFNFAKLCKVWAGLDKLDIRHFILWFLVLFSIIHQNINFVQSGSYFTKFSTFKKIRR